MGLRTNLAIKHNNNTEADSSPALTLEDTHTYTHAVIGKADVSWAGSMSQFA